MAFKRWKKSPSRRVPARLWDNNEMKIVGWCINKNIKVGISPDWQHDLNKWQIEISINNNIHLDPNRYDDDNVLDKLYEYYKYYYDKYNKQ
tara:strand:+ start:159 stop:431 length:273 start_codon:yes stop_codon:yes gene_type:complete